MFYYARMSPPNLFERFLSPYRELAYAALRIVAGVMFTQHGVQKLFGLLTDHQPPVGSQVWLGGVIELVCGVAITLGIYASPAAFLASGTMAVAYVQFHWKLAFDTAFFPVVNKGEPAVLYCFLFLFIACAGGGRYSLERRVK